MSFFTNVKVLGNNILYRGIEDGKKVQFKHKFDPTFHVISNKITDWKNLEGDYVEPINKGSIKEARNFLTEFKDVENFKIYGDIGFDIKYIAEKFPEEEINWDIGLMSIHIIDIECKSENGFPNAHLANEEILLISMLDINTKKTVVFTSTKYCGNSLDDVNIILCDNEYDLLNNFIAYWANIDIDIVTGWNIEGFDIPYLINRIENVIGEGSSSKLSPWNRILQKNVKDTFGNDVITYEIVGVSALDYLNLYKKYTYNKQESYTLDFISQEELGVGKLDWSEFPTFKDFYSGTNVDISAPDNEIVLLAKRKKYIEDLISLDDDLSDDDLSNELNAITEKIKTLSYDKFLQYNIIDCQRILELEEKMKLLELALTISFLAKINFNNVFSQIQMWDSIIYNYLLSNNIVIPPKSSKSKTEQFEGAYVKEPVPGFYEWVVSFDATSLYPSIIQTWNISPETFMGISDNVTVNGLLNHDCILSDEYSTAANGAMYSKNKKGIMPELVDVYMKKRKDAKSLMLKCQSELEELKIEFKNRGLEF